MRILKENEVSGIIENLRGKVEKVEFLIRDYVDDSGRQYKTLAVIRLNDKCKVGRRKNVVSLYVVKTPSGYYEIHTRQENNRDEKYKSLGAIKLEDLNRLIKSFKDLIEVSY
jgi:hypothetical protein